jgi:hypothetical protein
VLFFIDQYDITYAKVKAADHFEIFPIKSSKYEEELQKDET